MIYPAIDCFKIGEIPMSEVAAEEDNANSEIFVKTLRRISHIINKFWLIKYLQLWVATVDNGSDFNHILL